MLKDLVLIKPLYKSNVLWDLIRGRPKLSVTIILNIIWLYFHMIIKLLKVEKECVCVCVYSGLTSLSTIFQSYHDGVGCDRELNAHFYSAASMKYHVPVTWHDTTPSHIILTLGRPVLALPRKSECQARSS